MQAHRQVGKQTDGRLGEEQAEVSTQTLADTSPGARQAQAQAVPSPLFRIGSRHSFDPNRTGCMLRACPWTSVRDRTYTTTHEYNSLRQP